MLLVANNLETKIYGKGYSIEKGGLRKKLKCVCEEVLDGYLSKFLDQNAKAKEHLPYATNETLREWSRGLEEEVEKRYIYSPSTAVNRRKDHQEQIFALLQNYRKKAQDLAIAKPLQLTETEAVLPISLSMRLLLNENQQRNRELQSIQEQIKEISNKPDGEQEDKVIEIMHLLVQYMQQNNDYQENIREFFFGSPNENFLRDLKTKSLALSEFPEKNRVSVNLLGTMVDHCHVLQSINNRMIKNLYALFLYPHDGALIDDKEVPHVALLIKNAVEKIEALGGKLSEKNKLIFDQLCRVTALILWTEWIQDLKKASAPAVNTGIVQNNAVVDFGLVAQDIKKDWAEVMSNKLCTGDQLKKWFSLVRSGCFLPKVLVQKWLEELLDLLNVVEKGFLLPKFYYSISDRLPNLIDKLSQQLVPLLDMGSAKEVTSPAATGSAPSAGVETDNTQSLANELSKEHPTSALQEGSGAKGDTKESHDIAPVQEGAQNTLMPLR